MSFRFRKMAWDSNHDLPVMFRSNENNWGSDNLYESGKSGNSNKSVLGVCCYVLEPIGNHMALNGASSFHFQDRLD